MGRHIWLEMVYWESLAYNKDIHKILIVSVEQYNCYIGYFIAVESKSNVVMK